MLRQPGPKNSVFGLELLDLASQFLAGERSQEPEQRVQQAMHSGRVEVQSMEQ
jgi:hypothetical protein